MFISAEEARKTAKTAEESTRALAMERFKENKEKIFQHILTCAQSGYSVSWESAYYPDPKIKGFIPSIYKEEYQKIAEYFFNSLGYQITFEEPYKSEILKMADIKISWKEK